MSQEEQLHCPVCHCTTSVQLCTVRGYKIVCCLECQTDFVTNPPSAKELSDFYDRSEWFEGGEAGGYSNYDSQTESSIAHIKDFLSGYSGQSLSILDVGCGYGNHLELAASLGWECFGIEPSDHARAIAVERLGSRAMIVKDAEELIPHFFDVVLMLDVVEHVIEPQKLFYPLFALGGIREATTILLTTPNAGCTEAINNPGDWRYRHPPSHLVFYKASGLEQLLHDLRFREVSVRGIHPSVTGHFEDLSRYEGLEAVASGSDFHDFMRERYVPSTWSEIAEYEHFPRYELACRFATGQKVLDFGCGTGYGTAMLATKAKSALGVDIDTSALEWARRCHRLPNLSYQCNGNFLADFEDQMFDLATCFEMIEHVGEEDQQRTIQALARVLRPNGLLLISTPNPEVTSMYGTNPYHLLERTREEFLDLLKGAFSSVQLIDQYALAGVFFAQGQQAFSLEPLHDGPLTEALPLAYIAICSQETLPALENRGYLDTKRDYISSRIRERQNLVQTRLNAYQSAKTVNLLHHQFDKLSHQPLGSVELHAQTEKAHRETVASLTTRLAEIERQGLEAETLRAQTEKAHRETVASLTTRLAEIERQGLEAETLRAQTEKAHRETVTSLTTQLAEIEHALYVTRLSRMYRFVERLRTIRFNWKTPFRGALAISSYLRQQARRPSSNSTPDLGRVTPEVLESNDHAYTVRQSLSAVPNKPTVLHAIANFCLGGSSRLVVDLIESLGVDFEQPVVTRYIPRPPAYLNLTIYEHAKPSNSEFFQALIDQHKPVFVHVHYWGDCDQDWYKHVFHACEAKGVPVIQNINTPVAPHSSPAVRQNVYVSDYIKQTFGAQDNNAITIHPGSDFNHFSVEEITAQVDDCIGMVYRLESDKLNSSSIDVFIKVAQLRPATRCLIVGDGKLKPIFEQRVAEAGVTDNFVFTGYVPYQDLPDLYRQMSLFVAPVWKESFGQVSSFAMNMGLPVVGYAIGAIPSIIGDDQLLADFGNSEGLANLIIALLDNRQRRLAIGQRNHEKAQTEYSVETMIKNYSNLYASMTAGTPS
jgi:glycosyltransferase involved in cell wall biosynthesis/2-polyprenyl-3-methyl-5-hydroxy-6-metoxy-1,4-benzoquinol methylase